jgi:hypothetical protein
MTAMMWWRANQMLLRAILGRRRLGFFLLILDRLLLQFLHGLLQSRDGAFQAFDLRLRGIELLLVIDAEFCNGLLQEIHVALQAAGSALHGLFDRADLDAGNILCGGAPGCQRAGQRQ